MRGGSGLGDSLYLRPFAEAFCAERKNLTVMTDYPGVFRGLPVTTEKFNRNRITVCAHYTHGKMNPHTNQWDDVCVSAGFRVPLKFNWTLIHTEWINRILDAACGRPIVLVHGGRPPMGRKDGFGAELLPERKAFDTILSIFHNCYLISVGMGQVIYPLRANRDLMNCTTVEQLMDLGSICHAMVAQCSFCIPLAEGFDKPLLCVWSDRGLNSREIFIRAITPNKVLSKGSSRYVVDSWDEGMIRNETVAFRNAL